MRFTTACLTISFVLVVPEVLSFNSALFPTETQSLMQGWTTKDQYEDIEMPNFDELFGRIKQVSPLARIALDKYVDYKNQGFRAIDESCKCLPPNASRHIYEAYDLTFVSSLIVSTVFSDLPWKRVEANKKRLVHSVEKIDNFQGLNAPLLRFRATLEGPCDGEAFANFVTKLEDRKKWDVQIDNVYEAYTIDDLNLANRVMGFKYGDCSKMGVGHCITKANMGIDAREQLTMCGINDFDDGSSIIWGTEMEERHNYLFPPGKRTTRARSHLFSTTLSPTSVDSFDVEYVIQLDIGGKIPTWMTTPIVIDNVKKMFTCVQKFYRNEDGRLEKFMAEKARRNVQKLGPSLLMTP